mgnify:CR=1 FL=1
MHKMNPLPLGTSADLNEKADTDEPTGDLNRQKTDKIDVCLGRPVGVAISFCEITS